MSFWDVLGSPAWGALESVGTAVAVGVAAWAAWQANATASKLTEIESQRRHSELCPVLRVTCEEDIKRHVWGPYRFTPGTGPDEARADTRGREVVFLAGLPLGEELQYQLEQAPKGNWMPAMTQEDWLQQQGAIVRLAFTAESEEHGTWHLPCEIDTKTLPATAYVPQSVGS